MRRSLTASAAALAIVAAALITPSTTTTTAAGTAPTGYELPRIGRSNALAGFGTVLLASGAGRALAASRSRIWHPAR